MRLTSLHCVCFRLPRAQTVGRRPPCALAPSCPVVPRRNAASRHQGPNKRLASLRESSCPCVHSGRRLIHTDSVLNGRPAPTSQRRVTGHIDRRRPVGETCGLRVRPSHIWTFKPPTTILPHPRLGPHSGDPGPTGGRCPWGLAPHSARAGESPELCSLGLLLGDSGAVAQACGLERHGVQHRA